MKSRLMAAALAVGVSGSALAETYVGVGVGSTDYEVDEFENPTGLSVYLGERVSESLAIEGFYTDFGTAKDEIFEEVEINASSFGGGLLLGGEPAPGVNLFVSVGVHAWDAEVEADIIHLRADDNGSDVFYGFGGAFDIGPGLRLGARYTNYEFDEDDVSLATVNLEARF